MIAPLFVLKKLKFLMVYDIKCGCCSMEWVKSYCWLMLCLPQMLSNLCVSLPFIINFMMDDSFIMHVTKVAGNLPNMICHQIRKFCSKSNPHHLFLSSLILQTSYSQDGTIICGQMKFHTQLMDVWNLSTKYTSKIELSLMGLSIFLWCFVLPHFNIQ